MRINLGQGSALLAVGASGGLTMQWLGVPAGMIVGPLLASGLYRLAGGEPGPWQKRYGWMGRLLLGTVVGAAYGPDIIAPLKAALLPMVVLIAIISVVGLGLGWALGRFTQLDVVTAMMSAMPGGLPAMVAMAGEVGADATVVAAIHFSRLVTILVTMPALVPLLATAPPAATVAVPGLESAGLWSTLAALAAGLLGGLLALRVGIPAGDLLGPILVVGGVNLLGAGWGPLAGSFRHVAMLLVGTAAGAQVSQESLRRLRQAALPSAVVIVTLIVAGLLLGWGLAQVTPLDLSTALLSSVPGGASTMPAVAHDLGGDMRLVAALHLARQLVVFVLVPSVLSHWLRGRHREAVISPGSASNS